METVDIAIGNATAENIDSRKEIETECAPMLMHENIEDQTANAQICDNAKNSSVDDGDTNIFAVDDNNISNVLLSIIFKLRLTGRFC